MRKIILCKSAYAPFVDVIPGVDQSLFQRNSRSSHTPTPPLKHAFLKRGAGGRSPTSPPKNVARKSAVGSPSSPSPALKSAFLSRGGQKSPKSVSFAPISEDDISPSQPSRTSSESPISVSFAPISEDDISPIQPSQTSSKFSKSVSFAPISEKYISPIGNPLHGPSNAAESSLSQRLAEMETRLSKLKAGTSALRKRAMLRNEQLERGHPSLEEIPHLVPPHETFGRVHGITQHDILSEIIRSTREDLEAQRKFLMEHRESSPLDESDAPVTLLELEKKLDEEMESS